MDDEDFSRPEIKYILKSARTGRATIAINVRECPITYYHTTAAGSISPSTTPA
jgi:hypothetical protein